MAATRLQTRNVWQHQSPATWYQTRWDHQPEIVGDTFIDYIELLVSHSIPKSSIAGIVNTWFIAHDLPRQESIRSGQTSPDGTQYTIKIWPVDIPYSRWYSTTSSGRFLSDLPITVVGLDVATNVRGMIKSLTHTRPVLSGYMGIDSAGVAREACNVVQYNEEYSVCYQIKSQTPGINIRFSGYGKGIIQTVESGPVSSKLSSQIPRMVVNPSRIYTDAVRECTDHGLSRAELKPRGNVNLSTNYSRMFHNEYNTVFRNLPFSKSSYHLQYSNYIRSMKRVLIFYSPERPLQHT